MSAQMHDGNDQDRLRLVFIQNGIGKAMDHAPSDIPSDLGPSGRMLHDLIDRILDLSEKIPPQTAGSLLII
jgi:hypothetical protein